MTSKSSPEAAGPWLTLHQPDEVFSVRHVPSWLMLAFSSGCVNAVAFVACERFVTHLTGNATQVGAQVVRLGLLLDFLVVFACFVMGAMASAALINGRAHRGKRPLFALALVIVAVLTASMSLAGQLGWLGDFGGSVDEAGDFVLLSVLSFASGMQNAAVATSTGLLVRTTHLTGPATDLGIHLVELASATGELRRKATRHALLRAGKILAFIAGGIAGVVLAHEIEYLALLLPAAIISVTIALSFAPRFVRHASLTRRLGSVR
jgi:uncharacterized membrane protein YoaK (UPF0700 family)